MKESPPGCTAELKGKNLSEWTATIQGPPGSPYQDGTFILDIIFPREYPFKPPTVTFLPLQHQLQGQNLPRHLEGAVEPGLDDGQGAS